MSKKDKTKAAPARGAQPAPDTRPTGGILDWMREALLKALNAASIRAQAKKAGEGLSALIHRVAAECGSLDSFNAAMVQFGNWLKSADGIAWQKAEHIRLELTKGGDVKLPSSFKSYATHCRRYLEACSVDKTLPAISTFKSESKVREALGTDAVQKALNVASVSQKKLTEAERTRILQEQDTRRHVSNEMRLLGERISTLHDDRLTEAVKALHAAADVVGKLAEEVRAEENAARQAAEAKKQEKNAKRALDAGEQLPVAAGDTAPAVAA